MKNNDNISTVILDHVVQEFNIKIRSLDGVSKSTLKNLIETRFEVVDLEIKDYVIYGQSGSPDFVGEI